jgi:hypothetical protein
LIDVEVEAPGPGSFQRAWALDDAVDLTAFHAIEVEWEFEATVLSGTPVIAAALNVHTSKTASISSFTARLLKTSGFGRQTDRLDISGLTGELFIRLHGLVNNNTDTSASGTGVLKVYRVSLITSSHPIILAWNEIGWQVLWADGERGSDIDHAIASSAYGEYRLWFGNDEKVYFLPLQRDIINPNHIATFEYAVEGETITPWFDAGQAEVTKLALSIIAEPHIKHDGDTIKVSYATDHSPSWTELPVMDEPGLKHIEFGLPLGDDHAVGKPFQFIRFRVQLEREDEEGEDKFHTPDLHSLTLVYRKKLPPKYGFSVHIDLSNDYKGRTPLQMREALIDAIESDTLVELTYRNDSSGERNYWVDIHQAQGLEFTGQDERGEVTLFMVEP